MFGNDVEVKTQSHQLACMAIHRCAKFEAQEGIRSAGWQAWNAEAQSVWPVGSASLRSASAYVRLRLAGTSIANSTKCREHCLSSTLQALNVSTGAHLLHRTRLA